MWLITREVFDNLLSICSGVGVPLAARHLFSFGADLAQVLDPGFILMEACSSFY